ncbi:MAG TPA: hypothetical protein VGH11_01970 [Jatrophihabitans sp.]|jgi:hypothetical protein
MPRSLKDIIAHADELADRFEQMEPGTPKDIEPLRRLATAVTEEAEARSRIVESVVYARRCHTSWTTIGAVLGTSGESARQRYAAIVSEREKDSADSS